jgi:hypothetical protein
MLRVELNRVPLMLKYFQFVMQVQFPSFREIDYRKFNIFLIYILGLNFDSDEFL